MEGFVITEEQVTKTLLGLLTNSGWSIISYDFPQSGTGKLLRLNGNISEKNKDGIIPDIITIKGTVCLFFENKDKVDINDFKKTSSLIHDNMYTDDISNLLRNYKVEKIYYGIAFPSKKWNKRASANSYLVDFIMGVTNDKRLEYLYNPYDIIMF